jgi:hypothetical protein
MHQYLLVGVVFNSAFVSGTFSRMKTPTRRPSDKFTNLWSCLFPLTYLIHIAEEYWGGEGYSAYIFRIRGVHMSSARFLAAQSIGFFLVTLAVILARKLSFPQTMLLILGTIVLINGLTHSYTSISTHSYGPGLYSSILLWLPLGIMTLVHFRSAVSTKRYLMCIGIGVLVNVLIGVVTMRGGRLV